MNIVHMHYWRLTIILLVTSRYCDQILFRQRLVDEVVLLTDAVVLNRFQPEQVVISYTDHGFNDCHF